MCFCVLLYIMSIVLYVNSYKKQWDSVLIANVTKLTNNRVYPYATAVTRTLVYYYYYISSMFEYLLMFYSEVWNCKVYVFVKVPFPVFRYIGILFFSVSHSIYLLHISFPQERSIQVSNYWESMITEVFPTYKVSLYLFDRVSHTLHVPSNSMYTDYRSDSWKSMLQWRLWCWFVIYWCGCLLFFVQLCHFIIAFYNFSCEKPNNVVWCLLFPTSTWLNIRSNHWDP